MTHLARSIAPLKLYNAATAHDLQTRQTYTGLLNFGEITDEKWMQATLPIKHGGFGTTSVREISQFAFISSWSYTLSILPTRFPIMEKAINDLIFQNNIDTSIALEIHQALPSDESLSELVQKPMQLQRLLTQQHMYDFYFQLRTSTLQISSDGFAEAGFGDTGCELHQEMWMWC